MGLPDLRDVRGPLLVIVGLCGGVWCSTVEAGEPDRAIVESPAPGSEAVDRRTVDSKHFDLGGGRFQARISSVPLHYLDREGGWKNIDTSLNQRGEDRFVADENGLRVNLPDAFRGEVEVRRRPQSIVELGSVGEAAAVDSTVRFTPVAIRWFEGVLHRELELYDEQGPASVDGGLLDFGEVSNGVSASYRVVPNGLSYQLTLSANPEGPAHLEGGHFETVWSLELPQGAMLRSGGEVVSGAFTTKATVAVVSRNGVQLLDITAPRACEFSHPRETVRGSLSLRPDGSGWQLTMGIPAEWMTDPEREFPIEIRGTVTIQPPSADTFISNGLGPQGSFEQLWVGNDGFFTPSRTLPSPRSWL